MRTPTLQYLYLQKPLTLILIIAALALLPWLALDNGHFFSFHEPHAAIAYLEALAFIGYSFVFLGRRLKLPEVFTASLVLITAFATQSYFFCNAVEMLFALLFLITIVTLFKWEENGLNNLPWAAILSLSFAAVIKGWGIIFLALLIFGAYILSRRYPAKTVIKSLLIVGILSAIIPTAVYFLYNPLWLRFAIISESTNESLSFYIAGLLWGLSPWVVYFIFSVFGINPSAAERRRKKENRPVTVATETEQKVYLYSMIIIGFVLIGFLILPGKKAATICLIYPFAALFIARYAIFLTEYRTRVTRIFGIVLLLFSLLFSIGFIGVSFGLLDLFKMAYSTTGNLAVITVFELLQRSFSMPNLLNWALFSVLLFAQVTLIYQLGKKVNIKILYSCIGLYLALAIFFNLTLFLQL